MKKDYPKKYHASVPIEVALQKLAGGENIFTSTPLEAFHALMDAKENGQVFYTGCKNTDKEGRCLGHIVKPEETTEESDTYDRNTIHQS